jgi:hypothetical protein
MAIKLKNRDPKTTDFASSDLVINTKEGTLFFKSDSSLVKLEPSSGASAGWEGSAVTLTGKLTGGSIEIEGSNFDINGGNIDGTTIATSNITVGSGKTLDVSAGTLTLANNQISGDKVEGGTIASTTITTLATATINASDDIDIGSHDLRAATLTADGLTSGRIVFAGTNGVLSDDSDLTFSTDTLTAAKIGAFEAAGAINFSDEIMTAVNIDSGTIDGTTIATSNITVGSGKTLDVSAGTLTTSTAQKKAIVDGAGHLEVLAVVSNQVSNLNDNVDPEGNSGAVGDWHGPGNNGMFQSRWSYNYGDDTQVASLIPSLIFTGISVPFACVLAGYSFVVSTQAGATSAELGIRLYYGDYEYNDGHGGSGESSFNDTSGTASALTLTQGVNCSSLLNSSANIGATNPMAVLVTNGTSTLEAQDMVYPRIKWANTDAKDLLFTLTILIKRT